MSCARRFLASLFLAFLVSGGANGAYGQQTPVSPRDSVSARIGGSDVTIVYGRPFTRDPRTGEPRKIWGGLVPYNKVWRAGANEATVLTTTRDLELGGGTLPAGSYSLFAIPTEKGGRLIVNRQTGQWGTQHDPAQDVLQVELMREPLRNPVDQFTISIEPEPPGGRIRFQWADAQYTVPFTVKR